MKMSVRASALAAAVAVALIGVACQPQPTTPTTTTTTLPTIPVTVTGTPTQVDATTTHGCTTYSGGAVRCWGNNRDGQLGNGTAVNRALLAKTVSGITDAEQVSVGHFSSCALHATGRVSCWGLGSHGRLGNGSTASTAVPVPVTGITDATSVTVSDSTFPAACVTHATGAVSCWGSNYAGQLASTSIPATTAGFSATPVTVPGVSGATSVSSGRSNICALVTGGAVRCWGDNQAGQVGDPSLPIGSQSPPAPPTTVVGISGASSMSMGNGGGCALIGTDAWCWGNNHTGQRGSGSSAPIAGASKVIGGHAFSAVTAGGVNCGLAGTTAYCWGPDQANKQGQIGNPSVPSPPPSESGLMKPPYAATPLPVTVVGRPIVAIESGDTFSCAILDEGSVRCWGHSAYSALGTGIGIG